jgi:hypothetical protein
MSPCADIELFVTGREIRESKSSKRNSVQQVSFRVQRQDGILRKAILVRPKQHRARRYSFVAPIELTDLQSEVQLKEQTSDLSVFGCRVDTLKFLPTGTRVRIRICPQRYELRSLG